MRLPVKAVIFDMDGVLVDSRPLYCRVIAETLGERGIVLSVDEIAGKVIPHVTQWVDLLVPYNLDGREHTVKELTQKVRDRMATVPATLAIADGAEAVLSELSRRCPLFLITNSGIGFAERVLSQAQLSRFFERVITANDGFPGKEAAIAAVTGERGILPQESVYIGDTEHDVVYGKKAGSRVIIVYTPFSWVYGGPAGVLAPGPERSEGPGGPPVPALGLDTTTRTPPILQKIEEAGADLIIDSITALRNYSGFGKTFWF